MLPAKGSIIIDRSERGGGDANAARGVPCDALCGVPCGILGVVVDVADVVIGGDPAGVTTCTVGRCLGLGGLMRVSATETPPPPALLFDA